MEADAEEIIYMWPTLSPGSLFFPPLERSKELKIDSEDEVSMWKDSPH